MKITYAITKGNWGGAQKYVFDLATAIKTRGYEVSVVFGAPGKLEDVCQKAGITTRVLPLLQRDIHLFKEVSSFLTLRKILKEERPDILHLNSPKMGGLGSLAAQIVGVPKIIYTAHGWSWNEDRSPLSKLLIKLSSWFTILMCDKVIVLSNYEKEQVSKWPWVKNKIVVIPIGVEPIAFLEREEARNILRASNSKIPTSSDTIWFGNIAELHRNKGLEYAIEAVGLLPKEIKCIYIIIGIGEELSNLQKLIDKLGLSDKVFLAGFQENAAKLLKAFDIFLFSSIKEGLPYTILEAGLAQLPVISTDVGSIHDVITDKVSGILVKRKKSELLKDAVILLSSNQNIQDQYAKELHETIQNRFSALRMVDKIVSSCYIS